MELKEDEAKVVKLAKNVTLESTDSAQAVAEFSGRIKEVRFKVGDFVVANQILAVFDQSDINNSPKIAFETAQHNLQIAQDNLKRTQEAAEESIEIAHDARKIAELQYDQAKKGDDKALEEAAKRNLELAKDQEDQAEAMAEVQVNGAKLQLSQAEAGVKQAQIAYEKTFIKAPISGIVTSRMVKEGDFLAPGRPIAQIVGKGNARAVFYLNEKQAKRVQEGDSVEITTSTGSYQGDITAISPIANESNQRFEVEIEVEVPTWEVNKTANITLNLSVKQANAFFIPLEAVIIGQQQVTVFVAKDEHAIARQVKIGEIIGDEVEVTEGLTAGDIIIMENARNLQDGQKIEIQAAENNENNK
jgi:cobalt-zinc-cadmium efflux system membrane fusion protein